MEKYNGTWLNKQFEQNPDKTAAEFARALELDPSTVARMRKDERAIKVLELPKIREFFGLEDEKLGGAVFNHLDIRSQQTELAEGGDSSVLGRWSMPTHVLKAQTETSPDNICVIQVDGDSMSPVFNSGDHVLVDTSQDARKPTPPGYFVVQEGDCLVVKQVEYIPGSDPIVIKVKSVNKQYSDYDIALNDGVIQGRVLFAVKRV